MALKPGTFPAQDGPGADGAAETAGMGRKASAGTGDPASTTFPAKRRRVQWSWPSSAGLQASAIMWASPRSSNFRCRLAWRRSNRDPANPSWVNRCLIR